MDREADSQTIGASRATIEQRAGDAGGNAGRRQVDAVGSHGQGDVEAIVHDQKRVVRSARPAQPLCELEELATTAIPGPELHDDASRRARGFDDSHDTVGG